MNMISENENNKGLIALAIFLSLAFLLPYHVNPFPSFYNDWLAALGCVLTFIYWAQKRTNIISIPSIVILPIGLMIVISIQTSLGMLTVSWDAILPLGYLAMAAMAIIFGATITGAEKNGAHKLCLALGGAFLAAGLLSVFIAICQFTAAEALFVPFMMEMAHVKGNILRPTGNIAQTNQLALLLCMSIASVWCLFQTTRLRAGLAIGMVLFLICGLAVTQSRIGWIVMPLFAFFGSTWSRQGRRVSAPIIIGLVLTYGILIFCLPVIAALFENGASTVIWRSSSAVARKVLFQQAWQISLAYPWFGAGWAEFGPQQVAIASAFPPSVYSAHAHNIILNFAAELGWPITLIVFGSLTYWIVKACFLLEKSKEAAFGFLCFFAVIVHSMLEYPLWYGYVLFPICFLIGMVHQEQFGSRKFACSGKIVITTALLATVCLVGIAMDYQRIVAAYWWGRWESVAVSMGANKVEKPAFTIFPQFYDYLQFRKTTIHPGISVEEIASMEKITSRFGYGASLLRLSLAYGLNGKQDEAVKTMLTIYSLSPFYYGEAYDAWQRTATDHPEYRSLLRRLPVPNHEQKSVIAIEQANL